MIISRVNSRSSLYYCGIISVLCSYIIIMCLYVHAHLFAYLVMCTCAVCTCIYECVCVYVCILIIYACPYITCILMFGINM